MSFGMKGMGIIWVYCEWVVNGGLAGRCCGAGLFVAVARGSKPRDAAAGRTQLARVGKLQLI